MFIKLDKADVYGIVGQNGGDVPLGVVYINTEKISHIDGHWVIVDGYVFNCTDDGLEKVINAINKGVKGGMK